MGKRKDRKNGNTVSRPITPEDRRDAIEHALRRTKPIFHLTEDQVEHIGEMYRKSRRH
ncbi:MAG: hypothetical protein OXS35_04310 [Dehalococcoidia bacterium]|nr:hypothetical protein [Dehalococcoidia bacterium]